MSREPDDPVAKDVALRLLALGIGSPSEIAQFAGVTRQVVENWAKRAGIDWRKVRRAKIAEAWRKAIARVPVQERRQSARSRVHKRAARARRTASDL